MKTTRRLCGTRKRFITDERHSSGMYLPRSIPIKVKCMPQHISKTMKAVKMMYPF